MSYIDLEREHALRDVLPPEDYRDKAHQMNVAFRHLLRHRGSTQRRDLMPGIDEARLWSTIVCSYSLLEQSLREAIAHPAPLEEVTVDELNDWERKGCGVVNAFSRYLRTGSLDNYSDAMRKWLDDSVAAAENRADLENDVDLKRFLRIASRCCLTFHDGQFALRNHRPLPIDPGALNIHDGWTIEWHTEAATWRGPVDDVTELPLRAGQSFTATWYGAADAQA